MLSFVCTRIGEQDDLLLPAWATSSFTTVAVGTGGVLEVVLGSGLGLGLAGVLEGEGLGLTDGDGVEVSDGDGVEVSDGDGVEVSDGDGDAADVSDGDGDGLTSLVTNAAVSTADLGGDEHVVVAWAMGAMDASAAGDRMVPKPRMVNPAAAHSAARLANSVLTTVSSIRSTFAGPFVRGARRLLHEPTSVVAATVPADSQHRDDQATSSGDPRCLGLRADAAPIGCVSTTHYLTGGGALLPARGRGRLLSAGCRGHLLSAHRLGRGRPGR